MRVLPRVHFVANTSNNKYFDDIKVGGPTAYTAYCLVVSCYVIKFYNQRVTSLNI